jgi:hypothetical protein
MKMAVFLMMEAASTSETSLNFDHTTQCNNPEDSHLHISHICHTLAQVYKNISYLFIVWIRYISYRYGFEEVHFDIHVKRKALLSDKNCTSQYKIK